MRQMGKLIVLEGTDGSGKSTQFARLTTHLQADRIAFERVVFPQYDKPSSALLRMYLKGEFGPHPEDVNSYAASTFYAVDRYASFHQVWQKHYEAGGLVLADRWTTSNAVHQGAKEPPEQRPRFFEWLYDFEYEKLGLPKPDLVLYLDMPIALTERLMRQREQQTHTQADIHERDLDYLRQCRETAGLAAQLGGWTVIPCAEQGNLRSIEAIHQQIYSCVLRCLEAR